MKSLIAAGAATAVAIFPLVADAAAATKTLPTAAATTPAPAPIQVTHGPALTGLCLFSADEAQGTSLLGKAIDTQLQALANQVNKDLTALQTKSRADATALQSKQATMPAQEYALAMTTLNVAMSNIEMLAAERQAELDATEQEQYGLFNLEMERAAVAVYERQKCAVLLDRGAALLVNPAMDLTKEIVAGLNASKTTASFPLKDLPPPRQLTAAEAVAASRQQQ